MKYTGSCHCGGIRFEVEGELNSALACNCSICSKKATLLWFVPRENMTLLTPAENITTYTFNKHVIKHQFCPVCGVQPFGEGADPSGHIISAINIRCLDDVDLSGIPTQHYDGKSL